MKDDNHSELERIDQQDGALSLNEKKGPLTGDEAKLVTMPYVVCGNISIIFALVALIGFILFFVLDNFALLYVCIAFLFAKYAFAATFLGRFWWCMQANQMLYGNHSSSSYLVFSPIAKITSVVCGICSPILGVLHFLIIKDAYLG